MAKATKTEIPEATPVVELPEIIEVELTDAHNGLTSIIAKSIVDFKDGKAMVSSNTAELLRTQGFVK